MQVTMFGGLLPVNLPDGWFANAKEVKFAHDDGWQYIDFRPSNGPVLKFKAIGGSNVQQLWEEVENPVLIKWEDKPRFIEPRGVVKVFGQSGTVLDLTHLAKE